MSKQNKQPLLQRPAVVGVLASLLSIVVGLVLGFVLLVLLNPGAAIFWISSTRRWPCCRPVPRPTAWQTSRWRRSAPVPRLPRCGNHFSAGFERLSSISFSSSMKVLTSLNWR